MHRADARRNYGIPAKDGSVIALWCPDCKTERDMDRNGNRCACGVPG